MTKTRNTHICVTVPTMSLKRSRELHSCLVVNHGDWMLWNDRMFMTIHLSSLSGWIDQVGSKARGGKYSVLKRMPGSGLRKLALADFCDVWSHYKQHYTWQGLSPPSEPAAKAERDGKPGASKITSSVSLRSGLPSYQNRESALV